MSGHGDSIFSHVRTRLRQSRSSVMLTTSTQHHLGNSEWNNVPVAYRPVERAEYRVVDGYYLDRPLPGPPPPRARTTSPLPPHNPRDSLDFGNMKVPTPRTHRTRSAEIAQSRWSSSEDRDLDARNKRASVSIAIALPPDHLDPPPPYSKHPDPPSTSQHQRPRSQPPPTHATYFVKPYDPNDYVRHRSQDLSRPVDDVPIIAVPQPPTPVSPLNSLDLQYLGMTHPPPSNSNVTVDSLLTHPMLRQR